MTVHGGAERPNMTGDDAEHAVRNGIRPASAVHPPGSSPQPLVRPAKIFSFSVQRPHKGSSAATTHIEACTRRQDRIRRLNLDQPPAAARFRTFTELMRFGTEAKLCQ